MFRHLLLMLFIFSRIEENSQFFTSFLSPADDSQEEEENEEELDDTKGDYSSYDSLIKNLFQNYNKDVSPMIIKNKIGRHKLDYSVTIQNFKLLEVNDITGSFSIATDMYQVWTDNRLQWKIKDFGNITGIITRLDKVWSPAFTVYKGTEVKDLRDNDFRSVYLTSDGKLRTLITLQISSTCDMKTEDFPFDHHICDLDIGLAPFPNDAFEMKLHNADFFTKDLCSVSNNAWQILNITYLVNDKKEKKVKRPYEITNIKLGKIRMKMKRRAGFYMVMIVAPISVINGMSLVGVFMKSKHGNIQRLTIGLTHVMTMTFILSMLGEQLPRAENISLLGKFIITSLCGMIFATLMSTKKNRILHFLGVDSEYNMIESRVTLSPYPLRNAPRKRNIRFRTVIMLIFLGLNFIGSSYMTVQYVLFDSINHPMDMDKCLKLDLNSPNVTEKDFDSNTLYVDETEMQEKRRKQRIHREGYVQNTNTTTTPTPTVDPSYNNMTNITESGFGIETNQTDYKNSTVVLF